MVELNGPRAEALLGGKLRCQSYHRFSILRIFLLQEKKKKRKNEWINSIDFERTMENVCTTSVFGQTLDNAKLYTCRYTRTLVLRDTLGTYIGVESYGGSRLDVSSAKIRPLCANVKFELCSFMLDKNGYRGRQRVSTTYGQLHDKQSRRVSLYSGVRNLYRVATCWLSGCTSWLGENWRVSMKKKRKENTV